MTKRKVKAKNYQSKSSEENKSIVFGIIKNPWLIAFLLILVFLLFSYFKVLKIEKNPHYNSLEPGSLFFSEASYHYRYALIFSQENSPFYSTSHDTIVEYPGITNSFKKETISMEILVGYLYRILPLKHVPFHIFVIYFQCFFSSLALIIIFFITKLISKNNFIAFLSVLFYISIHASYGRMIVGVFGREDLPYRWESSARCGSQSPHYN
jgi:hypothetical protein